ncbi:MAG: hypothetical protein UR43_C0028G0011 [candidate division TM6 bacterium GW2011_GWF2_33_332]|nr:MAG: hypothetical protein UR43_C0028G0011 [candidate division TM6 bacterium GW2011_GWF2_33_332]
MIRTFEDYTSELTEDEANYIMPRILKILTLAIGKDKAVKNDQILKDINVLNPMYKPDNEDPDLSWIIKTRPARIRHMIHILRVTDTIPFLVATAVGYFISNEKEEIENYIGSIDDRLRSIYQIRRALKRQMKEWGKKPEGIQRQISFANGELTY